MEERLKVYGELKLLIDEKDEMEDKVRNMYARYGQETRKKISIIDEELREKYPRIKIEMRLDTLMPVNQLCFLTHRMLGSFRCHSRSLVGMVSEGEMVILECQFIGSSIRANKPRDRYEICYAINPNHDTRIYLTYNEWVKVIRESEKIRMKESVE